MSKNSHRQNYEVLKEWIEYMKKRGSIKVKKKSKPLY